MYFSLDSVNTIHANETELNFMLCKTIKILLTTGRIIHMARYTGACVKGIGIGLLIGAAAGVAGGMMANTNKRKLKKQMRSVSGSVTDLLDNIGYIFK